MRHLVVDDLDTDEINRILAERKHRREHNHVCECGCGTTIPMFTKNRKPQRYAVGHWKRRPGPVYVTVTLRITEAEYAQLKANTVSGKMNRTIKQCLQKGGLIGEAA